MVPPQNIILDFIYLMCSNATIEMEVIIKQTKPCFSRKDIHFALFCEKQNVSVHFLGTRIKIVSLVGTWIKIITFLMFFKD